MERGTCQTCAFYQTVHNECRFNPPTAALTYSNKKVDDRYYADPPDLSITCFWPKVDADDWCSHWKTALVGGRRKSYAHQLNDGDLE